MIAQLRSSSTVVALGALLAAAPAWGEPHGSLGDAPLCEASAVLHVSCAGAAHGCWLVADNEVRDRLFLLPISENGMPDAEARREVEIASLLEPKDELSDMEALARLSSGEILVYGSHSRNKECKVRGKRRRYLGLTLRNGRAVRASTGFVRGGKAFDWGEVFAQQPGRLLERVAATVVSREAEATQGDCEGTFDLEAAVVIPTAGEDAVWLGLRSPVVDGHAVLVRHDLAAGRLRLVDARAIDTGAAGIRGLARRGEWIYGLSGSRPGDEDRRFHLWRFPALALNAAWPDARPIEIDEIARVPRRSEGVDLSGGFAWVVQDGDQPSQEGQPCETDATWQRARVPADL